MIFASSLHSHSDGNIMSASVAIVLMLMIGQYEAFSIATSAYVSIVSHLFSAVLLKRSEKFSVVSVAMIDDIDM